MKTNYEVLEISLVMFYEDVITTSGNFDGDGLDFSDPNKKDSTNFRTNS